MEELYYATSGLAFKVANKQSLLMAKHKEQAQPPYLTFYLFQIKLSTATIICITGKIIVYSDGPRYLSTIPLKNFHLFKIAESVINFCLKKFSN